MAVEANQVVMVARSADLRLQVITDLLQTRWKASSQVSSGWTPWQAFPAVGIPGGDPGGGIALAAAQLPSADTKLGPGRGRLQVWFASESVLYSTTKSSEVPNAPWEPWSAFTLPPPVIDRAGLVSVVEVIVVPLHDGRLQLWANLAGEAGPSLWSTVKTGQDWQAAWSEWKLFTLPGAEDQLFYVTAAPLSTGQTELWALSRATDQDPALVYTAIREAAPGDTSDPLSGWGSWSLFEVAAAGKDEPPTTLPPAEGLLAVMDGNQRTYLWANTGSAYSNKWVYAYTTPPGSPFPWGALNDFPTPASQGQVSNSWMSAAPLPDGALQLFYLTAPVPPAEREIWTRWQEAGQAPSAWTQWYSFQ